MRRRRRLPPLTVIRIAELEIAGRVYFGDRGTWEDPPSGDEVDDISVLRNGDKLSDVVVDKLELNWDDVHSKLIAQAYEDEADYYAREY